MRSGRRRATAGAAVASALLALPAPAPAQPAGSAPAGASGDARPAASTGASPATGRSTPAEPAAAPDGGAAADAGPRPVTLQPGIALRYTWSDNIDLRGRGAEKAGSILELAPFLRADLATARGFGSLNYTLRGLKYWGSENFDREVRHDLRAVGDVDIAGDALRLAAVAQRFDVARSPFGTSSFDPAARATDRTTYTRADLSPYSIGRLTARTDYELRYRFSYVDPGTPYVSNVVHGVSGEIATVAGQSPVGAIVRGDVYQSNYDNGYDYRNGLVELLGTYAPDPKLRLAAGVNYASSSVLADADGKRSGVGPSLGLHWTPLAASQVAARWSRTYYTDVVRVQASHVIGRLRFGASYDRGVSDGNQAGLLYYDPTRLFVGPTGRPIVAGVIPVPGALEVGAGAGAPLVASGNQSPIVENEALVASVEYAGTRSGVILTAYATDQRPALVVPGFETALPLEQRGVYARYAYRLDARNTVSVDARAQTSTTPTTDEESTLTSVGLEWRTRLGRQTIGSIGARANRQRGSAGTPEYDERGVGAGVEYRF